MACLQLPSSRCAYSYNWVECENKWLMKVERRVVILRKSNLDIGMWETKITGSRSFDLDGNWG